MNLRARGDGEPPGQGRARGERPPGKLILAAAPIGRPDDASARLAAALASADVIAAEDTRRLRRLARDLGIELTGKVISYYDDVETARVPGLLAELRSGRDVLVISDAGTPAISDPGYRITAAAVEVGFGVTVVPGPSAVTAALAVSGLPSDRFCFEGFPPRRAGERTRLLAELSSERRTLVFFESPRRLAVTLTAMAAAFGPSRRAVACRELTKIHQEIRRGTLAELADWARGGVLGEITLVVAGATTVPAAEPGDLAARVAAAERAGIPRKEAIARVAVESRRPKREVYDAVVRLRDRSG